MDRQTLTDVGRASLFALGLLLAHGLFCATGNAQWLPDRNYTEGPGIRVGNLELHPGVALRAGYDNNVFRQAPGRMQGSPIIAVTPHLHLSTLSKQRLEGGEDAAGGRQVLAPVAFRTGIAATYFYYNLDRAPRNLEVDADAMVSILPGRPVGFEVGALYNRSTRPFTEYVSTGHRNTTYAVNTVTPTARMILQSRSGVLRGRLGYSPQISRFENDVFSYLDANRHAIGGDASWQFLPRTAFVYDASVDLTRYTDPNAPRAVLLLSDETRFSTRLGINGALTNSLGLRVLGGYASSLLKNRELNDRETFVGEAVLAYKFRSSGLELGYRRSVLPSRLGGWMQQDRGFSQLRLDFARVFAVAIEAGVAHVVYGRLLDRNGRDLGQNRETGASTDKRKDLRVDAGVHAEYRATNWFAIMADVSVLSTLTDFEYAGDVTVAPLPAKFTSVQAFGGVRAHY